MIWIGDKGRDIYSKLKLSEKNSKKFSVIKENFEDLVKSKTNRVYSRYTFLSRTQKEGETFENFLTNLRLLVKKCGYQDQDDMIRDAIVYGIQDDKVGEKDKSALGISKGRTTPSRKSATTKCENESKKLIVKDCKYCGLTQECKRCSAYCEACECKKICS